MTITNQQITLGPLAELDVAGGTNASISSNTLDNANKNMGVVFFAPKAGDITDVGFHVSARTGSPPNYEVAIVTPDANARASNNATVFPGSAAASYTPPSTGWKWVTLPTPATVTARQFIGARIQAGGVAPDASNNMAVAGEGTFRLPLRHTGLIGSAFVSSLVTRESMPVAVRYSDGTVYGFTLANTVTQKEITSTTTPDEIGGRFTVPFDCTVKALSVGIVAIDGVQPNVTFTLYDGSDNVLASTTWDGSLHVAGSGGTTYHMRVDVPIAPTNLTAGQTYRVTIKTDATSLSTSGLWMPVVECNAESDRAWLPGGTDWDYTERTDNGAWTDSAATIPPVGIVVSDITDPAAGGATGGVYAYVG